LINSALEKIGLNIHTVEFMSDAIHIITQVKDLDVVKVISKLFENFKDHIKDF